MKQTYHGLYTQRICVDCQPFLANSNVKIEGKTKSSNWKEEPVTVEEFGMSDISVSDISTP
jgi:hypothetical protein